MTCSKYFGFLQGPDGIYSSNRLAFLTWTLGLFLVWAVLSFRTGTLQPIPESVAMVLGILMTGKVVQVFGERNPSASTPSDPVETQ